MTTRLQAAIERFPIAGHFTIARGSRTEAVVVSVRLERDGHVGRGECVPYTRYDETPEATLAAIEALAERERRLAAREQDIRQREAELERWAEQHGAPSPSKDSLSGEDPPRQEAPAETASKRVHRASIKPGHGVSQELFVHLAGKQPKTKERSPVPAAEAPNPNKQVPKEAMEARALRVFVCSSLQGSDGHALLTSDARSFMQQAHATFFRCIVGIVWTVA